ncbi:MAG: Tex-like N-terminal domain-containing protein [Gemmataceae bacterium]
MTTSSTMPEMETPTIPVSKPSPIHPSDLSRIAQDLQIRKVQVEAVLQLLDEGNTIPFITRYRKERTGGLDEELLRTIQERITACRALNDRKAFILRTIESQHPDKLTDELRAAILAADNPKRLEDLYQPFKRKRNTLADKARERGLDKLAQMIWEADPVVANLEEVLASMINPEQDLATTEAILEGAGHIISEMIADAAEIRGAIRHVMWESGGLVTRRNEKLPEGQGQEYREYFQFAEGLKVIPPHRILAINRGEKDNALTVTIDWDLPGGRAFALERIPLPRKAEPAPEPPPSDTPSGRERRPRFVSRLPDLEAHPHRDFIEHCFDDALSRLLVPSLEREIRRELTQRAEAHAVQVFARNLRSKLLAPPLRHKRILAIDPAFRTGCKLAVLDETGNLLAEGVIYPHQPQNKKEAARRKLEELIRRYQIQVIAIGNGTACRETEELVAELIADLEDRRLHPRPDPLLLPPPPEPVPEVKPQSRAKHKAAPAPAPVAPAPVPVQSTEQTASTETPHEAPPATVQPETPPPETLGTPETASETSVVSTPAPEAVATPVPAAVQSGGETSVAESNAASAAPVEPATTPVEVAESNTATAAPVEPATTPVEVAAVEPTTAPASDTPGTPETATETSVVPTPASQVESSPPPEPFVPPEPLPPALPELAYIIVNEAGASVYSTSSIGREEFPNLDATLRGTVSIGRRLQDPLAELVKIDPQHVGVGLYQHDVNPKQLRDSLASVIESCVNSVGVDLNTASVPLLKHVSGLGPKLAEEIVNYRKANGPFVNRQQLTQIPGIGENRFVQMAGFLKIHNGEEPLDQTWIHPESYHAAREVLQEMGFTPQALNNPTELEALREKLQTANAEEITRRLQAKNIMVAGEPIGLPTVKDILEALAKPGRDPREDLPPPVFKKGIQKLEDLTEGMELKGTILNVVDFGAFVDVGLKDSGLVHISQMANRYVKTPHDVVAVGDVVSVWVLSVDKERHRVSLSMIPPGTERKPPERAVRGERAPRGERPPSDRGQGDRPPRGDRMPRGDRPQGDRSQGDRPQGDRPQGDRPQGDRPQGDRPQGDRPQGDRSQGDRSQGDRPQGDRPLRSDRAQADRGPRGDRGDRGGDRGGRPTTIPSKPRSTLPPRGVSRIGSAAQQRGQKKPGESPAADTTTSATEGAEAATPTNKPKKPNNKKPNRVSNELVSGGKTPLSSFSELAALLAAQEQQQSDQGNK